MNKELQKLLLAQQEEQSYHLPMEAEYSFYRRIANGDMELLKLNMNADTMEGMESCLHPHCRTKNTTWSF